MPRKRKVVGLFRPISHKELKGYSRTLSNPLGVTTIATVNGRGRSARSVARTESPAARLRRAKQLLKGASSMRLTSRSYRRNTKRKSTAPSGPGAKGFTAAEYEASRKASKLKGFGAKVRASAAREAAARKAAQQAAQQAAQVAAAAKAAKQAANKAKRVANLAKARAARSDAARSKWPAQYTVQKVTRSYKTQTGFGPYKRVLARKPTGKQALSWLYTKKKGGKLTYRKIPASAIEKFSGVYKTGKKKGEHTWTKARIEALRASASARVTKSGSAWVPNRIKEGPIKTKKHAKLLRAMRTFQAKGLSKTEAARKALKKYPIAQGQIFAGFMRVGKQYVTCSTRTHRPTSKRKGSTTYMKRVGSFTRNRKSRRRLRVARRSHLRMNPPRIAFTANRRRRASTKRRAASKLRLLHLLAPRKTRRSRKSRRGAARRRHSVRAMTPNRRRRKHSRRFTMNGRRRHSRRGYRRNGFMADLLNVLKTGAIVGAGFLTHRLLSNLVVDFLLIKKDGTGIIDKMASTNADGTVNSVKKYLSLFAKPLSGLVVVAAGIPLAQAVLPSKKVEVGAGMVASLIQQILIAGFTAASKTPDDPMATAAREISGYESSLAYGIHGKESIMPMYTPVGEYFTPMSGLGAFTQAAAGMGAYTQAAAGFSQAAAGYNATGEYFAPASLQGIGQYEGAGEQALLPSANQQVIDDGLRPDGDLDSILDLAESAAGVHGRRGVGEFFSAQRSAGGGFSEQTLPMRSQWIPNGPLWSGTLEVTGSKQSSEVPAGILASGGGNGILSG